MKTLQVLVGRTPEGENDFPAFDTLPVIVASPIDKRNSRFKWGRYIMEYSTGPILDRTSNHQSVSLDSPIGFSLLMLIVPAIFADQAAAAFQETCTILADEDAETFYETKHTFDLAADAPLKTWADKKNNAGI